MKKKKDKKSIKGIFTKIGAGLLGAYITIAVSTTFTPLIGAIYILMFKELSFSFIASTPWRVAMLLIFIMGIIIGIRVFNRKSLLYHIFVPSKVKVLISAGLSILYSSIYLIQYILDGLHSSLAPALRTELWDIPIYLIAGFISFYPFSAICGFIFQFWKRALLKKSLWTIIILLIILNPIVDGLRGALMPLAISMISEPCGVEVVDFVDGSTAKEQGLTQGEVIIEVDGIPIKELEEISNFFKNITSPKYVEFITENNTHQIMPSLDDFDNKYKFGLYLNNKLCVKEK